MPCFEFLCQECANEFDIIISNAKKDKVKCPKCDNSQLKQLFSPFNTASFRDKSVQMPMPSCAQHCGQGTCGFKA